MFLTAFGTVVLVELVKSGFRLLGDAVPSAVIVAGSPMAFRLLTSAILAVSFAHGFNSMVVFIHNTSEQLNSLSGFLR